MTKFDKLAAEALASIDMDYFRIMIDTKFGKILEYLNIPIIDVIKEKALQSLSKEDWDKLEIINSKFFPTTKDFYRDEINEIVSKHTKRIGNGIIRFLLEE